MIPKKIKVMHLTYTIEEIPEHLCGDRYGWCDSLRQTICICDSSPGERKREVLYHEVAHAVCSAMGIPEGQCEEVYVNRAAVGWMTVMRDNPALVEYLFDCKVNPPPIE